MKKTYYMPTINGNPAGWDGKDEYMYFAKYSKASTAKTKKTVQRWIDRDIEKCPSNHKYGIQRVEVEV